LGIGSFPELNLCSPSKIKIKVKMKNKKKH